MTTPDPPTPTHEEMRRFFAELKEWNSVAPAAVARALKYVREAESAAAELLKTQATIDALCEAAGGAQTPDDAVRWCALKRERIEALSDIERRYALTMARLRSAFPDEPELPEDAAPKLLGRIAELESHLSSLREPGAAGWFEESFGKEQEMRIAAEERIAELERENASAKQSNQDLVNVHNLIDAVLSDYNEGKLMPEAAIDRVADAVGDAF